MTTTLQLPVQAIRQHRRFDTQNLEIRDTGSDHTPHLTGYASVFDVPYEVSDLLGSFTETIRAGAFTKTIREADVRLLVNHDGIPLARTRSGTMRLSEDAHGLYVDATLDPASGLVRDLRSAMERGDLDEMSFAFNVIRDTWSPDYTTRDIFELRLFDVSVVTFPANDATSASLRSDAVRQAAAVSLQSDRVRKLYLVGAELRQGKAISAANAELVAQAIEALQAADEALSAIAEQISDDDGPGTPESDATGDDEEQSTSVDEEDGTGMRSLTLASAQAAALRLRAA